MRIDLKIQTIQDDIIHNHTNKEITMRYIHFQIEDGWSWSTLSSAEEGTVQSAILVELRNLKMRNQDRRVRCVDEDGRLLDMLP
jgi:hypothetical protein